MPATVLLDHDMKFLRRLQKNMKDAEDAMVSSRAAMTTAALRAESASASMNLFMAHVGELYGLLPQDVIDVEGNIHLLDPGWALSNQETTQPPNEETQKMPEEEPIVFPETVSAEECPEEEHGEEEAPPVPAEPISTTSLPCH